MLIGLCAKVLSKGHVKLLWVLLLQTLVHPLSHRFATNPTCDVYNKKNPDYREQHYHETNNGRACAYTTSDRTARTQNTFT